MKDPDYARMTRAELDDVARHIDGVLWAERAARLHAEIERRNIEGEPELPERDFKRMERRRLFSRNATWGGLAGACSFPISFVMLAASFGLSDRWFGILTVPMGWLLGVAAGTCWAALRLRSESGEINRFELWRDALSAAVAAAFCGCLLAPALVFGLSILFSIFAMLLLSIFVAA